AGKATQMRVGVRALEVAKQYFLRQQFLGTFEIAVEKHRQSQAQVRDKPRVEVADFSHAGAGEIAPLVDLFLFDVGQDAFDDVANLFHVDRERYDVSPATAFAFIERLARDLGQIELD